MSGKRYIYFFLILSVLTRCGYRFAGRGSVPQDIRTIAVPVFLNRTSETGVENILTSALVAEFTRTGRVRVADEAVADAVLKGTITSYAVSPIFYSPDGRIRRYRVTVVVDAELVGRPPAAKGQGGKMWTAKGLTENEDYDSLPDILLTKAGEKEAVERIARDLMEEVHDRIFEP